jgi:hypothetical protein
MFELKENLERLVASLPDRDPGDVIAEISRLAKAAGEDACGTLLAEHPELFDHKPALTRANFERVCQSDRLAVEKLLEIRPSGPAVIGDLLGSRERLAYDRVSDMFENVDFSRCSRLVMVGCGALPSTIFHVYDKTEVREIVGLDIRPVAIEAVSALVERFGSSRVKAELCDGRAFDYAGATVVFVANMVSPKAAVLARIADTAPTDVQIVLREPFSLGRLWADSGEQGLDPRLEVVGRARPSGYVALSRDVFLMRRNDDGVARER